MGISIINGSLLLVGFLLVISMAAIGVFYSPYLYYPCPRTNSQEFFSLSDQQQENCMYFNKTLEPIVFPVGATGLVLLVLGLVFPFNKIMKFWNRFTKT